MREYALEYAEAGYEVFPLAGKIPAISKTNGGNGVLDATSDVEQVGYWWSDAARRLNCGPHSNIGCRVPSGLLVIDIDPRSGGLDTVAAWEDAYGPLPVTLTSWSGRSDGGRHLWFRHPGGKLSAAALQRTGVDLKTNSGYVVLPPSVHPDTGKPYRWEDETVPPCDLPGWLAMTLRPPAPLVPEIRRRSLTLTGDSIADSYCASASWVDILGSKGWRLVGGNGDEDGSQWRHPSATTPVSATVRNGCLFVYSPNTEFEPTSTGDPHGYTRFRAFAVLEHRGDMSAAARALVKEQADRWIGGAL